MQVRGVVRRGVDTSRVRHAALTKHIATDAVVAACNMVLTRMASHESSPTLSIIATRLSEDIDFGGSWRSEVIIVWIISGLVPYLFY